MDVLIFAIEAGRFGPARLPQARASAGLSVAALCPADNILAQSDYLDRHFELPAARSAAQLARALSGAIASCRPELIIPADEQVVVLLHNLVRGRYARLLPESARALVERSLGDPEHFDAMLLKSETLALARKLGIAVPPGRTVTSAEDAVIGAEQIGYPVFIKHSFSWAGRGVVRCENADDVRAAFGSRNGAVSRLRAGVRRLLGRDWYPADTPVDIQAGIAGNATFCCALAWQGTMISGYAGTALQLAYPNGPSVAVQLSHHEQMVAIAGKMIAALGCTGFVGFDFMERDGEMLLIECNPRPVPVSHLGARIGVDHAAELADLLHGLPPRRTPLVTAMTLDVQLFPHALATARQPSARFADVPWEDRGLIRHVVRQSRVQPTRGRAPTLLPA